ncbi:MAG: hypothetical protein ACTSXO_02005 [Candidatus Heimdallarchaeota archaeon]
MSQLILQAKEQREFEEKVLRARAKGFLTETQKEALLAKFARRFKGERLSARDRNALRGLRNFVAHYPEQLKELVQLNFKRDAILELLSYVDQQRGIYCHICKIGLLIKRTVSAWIQGTDYELIIEQKPAQACQNTRCQAISFSLEVEKFVDALLKKVEQQLRAIRTTPPEKPAVTKCPICRSNALLTGQKGELYRHRQGLYHLRIQKVPLKTYCTVCHYQEYDKAVLKKVSQLTELLDRELFALLQYEG